MGVIVNLKDSDMPLEQIKNYVDAYKKQDFECCYQILAYHAEKIEQELKKRQQILKKVQYKITHFHQLKGGGK